MPETKQIVKIFDGIGENKLTFTSDAMEGIVLKILAAVQNPKLKFCRADAIAMFLGGIIKELEESEDTTTLKIIRTFIENN